MREVEHSVVLQKLRQIVAEAGGDRQAASVALVAWLRDGGWEIVIDEAAPLVELPPILRAAGARAVAAGADSGESLKRHLAELLDARENPRLSRELNCACSEAWAAVVVRLLDLELMLHRHAP